MGWGLLTYQPKHVFVTSSKDLDYDRLSEECSKILESRDSKDLDELFTLGGSSGGARPKILIKINNEDWIVKFPSSHDPKDPGLIEYRYSLLS